MFKSTDSQTVVHTHEETAEMIRQFEAYYRRVLSELQAGTHAVDGRSVAIANTSIETGLLWMKSALLDA